MINFDYLENLPIREPIKRPHGWRANSRHDELHSVDKVDWWKRVRRNLSNNIGKSFDMAFHYYCKQVPKYQQHLFLNEFKDDPLYSIWAKYYVDYNGNIQRIRSKSYKRPLTIKSPDYKVTYRLKKIKHSWDKRELNQVPWWDKTENYEKIVYGQIWTFESRRDPIFRQYKREQTRLDKLNTKRNKAKRKAQSLEIFNKSIQAQKEALKKARELDILKRDQAGFDDTSFKGSNYHGRKNKK